MQLLGLVSIFAGVCAAFPLESMLDKRLIKLGPGNYEVVTELKKLEYKREHKNFIDVTNRISIDKARAMGLVEKPALGWGESLMLLGAKQLDEVVVPQKFSYPQIAQYPSAVESLKKRIDVDKIRSNLEVFTSFFTRYYKSESGYESAQWLESLIKNITSASPKISTRRIVHKGWDQFSLIVTIPGEVDTIAVLGAHQDSANLLLPNLMRAPGADDDGSGTMTIIEALRILVDDYVAGNFKPYHTLEFHFYSAEEGGLLGSYDVYAQYHDMNKTVVGFLQQDMTGYTGSMDDGIHMAMIEDYTSPDLNKFVQLMGQTYCSIPVRVSKCGYACSDHASATEFGFPSSFVIEGEMDKTSKYIHSVLDTVDRLDFDHIYEHVALAIGFAYELSLASDLVDLSKV